MDLLRHGSDPDITPKSERWSKVRISVFFPIARGLTPFIARDLISVFLFASMTKRKGNTDSEVKEKILATIGSNCSSLLEAYDGT